MKGAGSSEFRLKRAKQSLSCQCVDLASGAESGQRAKLVEKHGRGQ